MSRHGSGFGGDERNPNARRYKAWNNPHKASNDGLADRRVYPENSNRPKYSESNFKQIQTGKNNQKGKLRSPAKTGLGQATIRINRSHTAAAKNSEMTKTRNDMTKVKADSESSERKQKLSNVSNEKKDVIELIELDENIVGTNNKEESSAQHENGNATELPGNEATVEESINKREISENEKSENGKAENGNPENGNSENGHAENGEIPQTQEKGEDDFALQLEVEENNTKPAEDSQINLLDSNKNEDQSETQSENAKDDSQTESQSCSVEIVESTTSEVTEVTESAAPSEIPDKNQDPINDDLSYNTNITLKDVKIKLNDCLKESKAESENNVDQSLPEYAHKEATFGKTLRTISGRKSIGRHITLRDRQPSPNSSLFVNTSNISVAEEGTSDYKILRHRTTVSDLTANNGGTPLDRKRKLIRDSPSIVKKAKTEESGLLNYSLELLKYPFSPRRPVQVSTPYKFEAEKHISTSEEVVVDEPGTAKKWCAIM